MRRRCSRCSRRPASQHDSFDLGSHLFLVVVSAVCRRQIQNRKQSLLCISPRYPSSSLYHIASYFVMAFTLSIAVFFLYSSYAAGCYIYPPHAMSRCRLLRPLTFFYISLHHCCRWHRTLAPLIISLFISWNIFYMYGLISITYTYTHLDSYEVNKTR